MSAMATTHVQQSIDHLAAVTVTRDYLHDLYDLEKRGHRAPGHGAQIAEAHQKIGHGLKAAQIEAQIAQAIALESIAGDLAALRRDAVLSPGDTMTFAQAAGH